MTSRTTRQAVTFVRPFRLAGYDDELPAGEYQVDVDEELLEGLSFEAYRRTGTYLLVGSKAGGKGSAEMRPIDPRDLDAALMRDRDVAHSNELGKAVLSPPEERT